MFEDKVWWITRASSGIGAALAESVARAGAKLVLSGRNVEALEKGERELILAEGWEADAAHLRRSDPDALFDLATKMVAEGYARKLDVEAQAKGG